MTAMEISLKVNKLSRGRIVQLLEGVAGIQCYDHEDISELRAALVENVADETIPEDMLEYDE